jgi:hypothetical protein
LTKKNINIDLASLDLADACNKPYELELLHPVTKAPLGAFIGVLGKESDRFKDYIRTKVNDKLRRDAVNRKRGKDEEIRTVEQNEQEAIELLVVCTTHFRELNFNGPMEFSVANATKLYSERPWVREQVDAAITDIANFM